MRDNLFFDKATVWKKDGTDYQGEPKWDGPYHIDARWEDTRRLTTDSDGKQRISESTVYLKESADRGDFIIKGKYTESEPPKGAREIIAYREIPNLTGNRVERRVEL